MRKTQTDIRIKQFVLQKQVLKDNIDYMYLKIIIVSRDGYRIVELDHDRLYEYVSYTVQLFSFNVFTCFLLKRDNNVKCVVIFNLNQT